MTRVEEGGLNAREHVIVVQLLQEEILDEYCGIVD